VSLHLSPDLVPVFVSGLRGVTNVDDGTTVEQERVLRAIAAHLWRLDDAAYVACAPCSAADVASGIRDAEARRRFVQLGLILELCRHPDSPEQVRRLDRFAGELGIDGPQLEAIRSWVAHDAEHAAADFVRNYHSFVPGLSDPDVTVPPRDDPSWGEVLPQVAALADLPEGTLGWAYLQFYARHGFALPGRHTPEPAYYVSHDMNHVIAGYEPTGPGEISLGAFKLAMSDTDANWMAFVANLMIHEAGLIKHGTTEKAQFVPYGGEIYPDADGQGALHLPGAADELAEALVRGAAVRGDFSQIDHLAIAHRLLAEIREDYHVLPRADGHDEGFGR
jgi:hypothetical protein